MRIYDLIFGIIEKEVPMDPAERTDLRAEIKQKYDKIQYSDEYINGLKAKKEVVPVKSTVKKFLEQPETRTLFAILFIPALRWARNAKMVQTDEEEEEEDEL